MTKSWKQLSEICRVESRIEDLENSQVKWLLDCIKRNAITEYGKRCHFDQIHTITDFQRLVPVVSYEDISDSITDIAGGRANSLFTGKAIAFERTSGSTDKQKLIPYSTESIFDFRKAILPWLATLAERYGITSGKAYWAISPATRQPEVTESGIPVGLPDAAYLGEDFIPFFLESSVVPQWVAEIRNFEEWQLATLYFLVSCRDLKLISVWSPTFLLLLINALDERRSELESVFRHGIEKGVNPLPANSIALDKLLEFYSSHDLNVLWPELKVISCWSDASSAVYADKLRKYLPSVPIQPKGLLMTEGVVTVPNKDNQSVLTSNSGFYEFLDGENSIHLAHELNTGEDYEVIMTTSGGLYRYRTYDRVHCDGFSNNLPVLRFIGRESTSDMVGEKLIEEFVTSCFEGIDGFRMLIPVKEGDPGYLLVIEDCLNKEEISSRIESRLSENPHYAYARNIGQLQPLKILPLKDPLSIYLNSPLHAGTRLGDIKVPSLCLKTAIFIDYLDKAA